MFRKTLWRLIRQSAIPAVLALAYSIWSYISKGVEAKFVDAVTAFGGAFFFCMWFVGQFFRAAKQMSDSESFSKLSAGIEDINRSIRELRSPSIATAHTRTFAAPTMQLMLQARQLVQNGHVLAGLLQAGVAFEQAVHDKAKRLGLKEAKFRGVGQILNKFENTLAPEIYKELRTIWNLRNQIVHADAEALSELQSRPELLGYIERGIDMLGQEGDPF